MNFQTLGPRYSKVVSLPPQRLTALFFYLPLKMPLAVDESPSHFFFFHAVNCSLFSLGFRLSVSTVFMFFCFHMPDLKHLKHLPMVQWVLQSKQKAEWWAFAECQVLHAAVCFLWQDSDLVFCVLAFPLPTCTRADLTCAYSIILSYFLST